VLLTLSLCTSVEADRCDGVLLLVSVPVPLDGMPAFIGDVAFAFDCLVILWVLVRHVLTNLRLENPLWGEKVEITSCLLPIFSMPLRLSTATLPAHRLILGISSGMGWMRFLQDSFKFSASLGPLVLMVIKMCTQDVVPFVAMWLCFFSMCFSSMWGIYHGMQSSTSVAELVTHLVRYTINPDTSYLNSISGDVHDDYRAFNGVIGMLECIWIMLSNVISLNVLIAMMNTTYSQVQKVQDAQWRVQFLEQVLFQEATPAIFVPPSKRFSILNRPAHHLPGKLSLPSPNGTTAEVDCHFMMMELSKGGGRAEQNKPKDEMAELEESLTAKLSALLDSKFEELSSKLDHKFEKSQTKRDEAIVHKLEVLGDKLLSA